MQRVKIKKGMLALLCCFLAFFFMVPFGMQARAADAPTAPVVSQLRNYGDGIQIDWEESAGASGYYLYRSEDGGSFKKIADISPADTTSYLDENVVGAGKYAYKLKAYVKEGTKKTTGEYSAKKTTYRVGATSILSMENQTKGIKVSWDMVPEATGYKVYRKTGDGEFKLMTTKIGADNTSYVNTSVKTGEIYSYWVKPYIAPILTNYYNWEDTAATTARLPKVTGVKAKALAGSPKRISVSWNALENVEGYIISQRNVATGKAKNYTVDGSASTIIIPVSQAGEYSYTVRAFVGEYQSAFSAKSAVVIEDRQIVDFQAVVNSEEPFYVNESTYRYVDWDCADIESNRIYGILTYDDGETETIFVSDFDLDVAPSEPGEFDMTVSYTAKDGRTFTDVVTLNAVYAEPLVSIDGITYQAGYRGSVNGVSLRKIIFTDMEEPADDATATKAYIGQIEPHAVIAWRYLGQEDTLYISSGRPGVKVIHPGNGTVNTGFIYEMDCRMLDTSRCTTTSLFWANGGAYQNGIKSINYSGCDFSNVTSLAGAFNSYTSLQYLDLSNCDFSNVTSLSHMCYNTPNLIQIDMSGTTWGEGKLTNLEYAFGGSGLQEIDLGGMETSAVTITQGMFVNDKNLLTVDLSGCDFSNVETAPYMFEGCESLHSINFNEIGMPSLKGSLRQMFDNCKNLRDVDMSNIYLGSEIDNVFRIMFNCQNLRTTLNIDATNFDRSYGYTFANMAIGDDANVIVNCTQASKDILDDYMIWATSAQYNQHVTYNIIDAPTIAPVEDEASVIGQLNNVLSSNGLEVDEVFFAGDITSNGSNIVEVTGIAAPEDAVLYHIGTDGIQTVDYTLTNGILRFTSDDFSPFVLATTKEIEEEAAYTKFLGQWYAQGTGIMWEPTVYADGTFYNHYPNYSVGDMTYNWELSEDGNTLILFSDNYSFDEYGNLTDAEWNAQGIHYAQRILSRIPNIMGWWRSEDSFLEGETYPDGEHGIAFYLNEHDYGKTFSIDSEGNVVFFDTADMDTFRYDVDTDTIIATHADGTTTSLFRWFDNTLQ